MNTVTQKAVSELHEILKQEMGSNVVSVEIFISNSKIKINPQTKSPAALKSDGISMKNIKGEWIK